VRERLLETALDAFAVHAYAEVSVDEIVKKARTTKPMLYYYFGSKAGLYETIATETMDLLRRGYERAADPEAPAVERLRAFVRADFATMRENPRLAQFIYRAAYSPPREAPQIDYWKLFLPTFQLVTEIVVAAQKESVVGAGPPPLLALPIFGLLSIWTQVNMSGDAAVSGLLSDEQADQVLDFYLHGVGAKK